MITKSENYFLTIHADNNSRNFNIQWSNFNSKCNQVMLFMNKYNKDWKESLFQLIFSLNTKIPICLWKLCD
jgi:hypothetical protein